MNDMTGLGSVAAGAAAIRSAPAIVPAPAATGFAGAMAAARADGGGRTAAMLWRIIDGVPVVAADTAVAVAADAAVAVAADADQALPIADPVVGEAAMAPGAVLRAPADGGGASAGDCGVGEADGRAADGSDVGDDDPEAGALRDAARSNGNPAVVLVPGANGVPAGAATSPAAAAGGRGMGFRPGDGVGLGLAAGAGRVAGDAIVAALRSGSRRAVPGAAPEIAIDAGGGRSSERAGGGGGGAVGASLARVRSSTGRDGAAVVGLGDGASFRAIGARSAAAGVGPVAAGLTGASAVGAISGLVGGAALPGSGASAGLGDIGSGGSAGAIAGAGWDARSAGAGGNYLGGTAGGTGDGPGGREFVGSGGPLGAGAGGGPVPERSSGPAAPAALADTGLGARLGARLAARRDAGPDSSDFDALGRALSGAGLPGTGSVTGFGVNAGGFGAGSGSGAGTGAGAGPVPGGRAADAAPMLVATAALGDLAIGLEGGPRDLRVSVSASATTTEGMLAGEVPRLAADLSADLAAAGMRLQSLDIGGVRAEFRGDGAAGGAAGGASAGGGGGAGGAGATSGGALAGGQPGAGGGTAGGSMRNAPARVPTGGPGGDGFAPVPAALRVRGNDRYA